ncbi:MAG TPA: endo-1,4-beta-xylanase [Thermoleophilaceae bacterium]|nr:endo-1,4-beta-xylanase [Thermoleophilaceae bacterium]
MPPRQLMPLLVVASLLGACAGEDQGKPIVPPKDAKAAPRLSRPLGAAVSARAAREDDAYLRTFVSNFTSLTPENEMKWAIIHPARGRYAFSDADALAGLARATGKRVRGHTLVWDQQLPRWVTKRDWTRRELRRVLVEHVKRVVSHFRGRVAQWDVVNEPLLPSGRLKENVFTRVLGPGYIALAFRAARAADPKVKLFLNENASEHPGPKQDALVALTARLRRRGVPLDGVGLQDHTQAGLAPGAARLGATMRRFTRLGLDVEITELDVAIPQGGSQRVQARDYAATAAACTAEPRCTGLTIWGVTDRWSWIGADKRALPFDERGRAKPALAAVLRALRR